MFLISLTFIAYSLQNLRNKVSTAQISSGINNFKISFNILSEDREQFEKSLEKLSFPSSIEEGVSFELDATSQAQLAFVAPVTAEISFSNNSISFSGILNRPYTLSTLSSHQLKLPSSTNVAIAGSNLAQFAYTELEFPQRLLDWIESNITPSTNQYFFNIQPDANIYSFLSSTPIEGLKSLEGKEISYIEESTEDTKIIYLTYQDPQTLQEKTISIAKAGDLVFMTSSGETIKELISFQKSPLDEIDFPNFSNKQISYAIYARNNSDQFASILRSLIVKSQPQTLEFVKNIESFYLALSKKSFSALIVIK